MLFDSAEFAIFFPVVVILFFSLPHSARWAMLLVASCFFYMFFRPVYILILGFTIVIDYCAGIWIEKQPDQKKKRNLLILSIVANVGVLVVFKYFNFIAINVNQLMEGITGEQPIPLLTILLPIGLSFHTFQAMSYTIEVYRGNQKAEKHMGIYALYVMFFPQLVAGPIERPQHVIHQFHEVKYFNYDQVRSGLILIGWGLFKKVVIANRLGLFVSYVYAMPSAYVGIPLILATLLFTVQILCDFSGYSDIAVGTARVMGFELMINFNTPLASKSVTEFWRRWHISLSTWFNDYVFLPLVMATRDWGKLSLAFSLLVTFLISGIWHGAGWTFVIYGLVHGAALVYEFYTRKFRIRLFKRLAPWLNISISTVLTFAFVSLACVFFRSSTINDAFHILSNLWSGIDGQLVKIVRNEHLERLHLFYLGQSSWELLIAVLLMVMLVIIHYTKRSLAFDAWLISQSRGMRWASYYLLISGFILFGVFNKSPFIYFQF